YAGQTVQLGFLFASHDNFNCNYPNWDVSSGWYIDDICFLKGDLAFNSSPLITASEETSITRVLGVRGTNENSRVRFLLDPGAPAGAALNAITGAFTWTPSEAQGPGTYRILVYAVDEGNSDQNACAFINVSVTESNKPPRIAAISDVTVQVGQPFCFDACATDPDLPA